MYTSLNFEADARPPAGSFPRSREPGLRLNPQLGRIPAKMRAELTSAEVAIERIVFR
jgi:hypothetical protein